MFVVVRCILVVVCCASFAVRCLWMVVHRLLFVVCCGFGVVVFFGVRCAVCSVRVRCACCMPRVAWWLLFDVCVFCL